MKTKKFTILHSNDMHGDFLAEIKGAEGKLIWPLLADALLARGHLLAAYAAIEQAREAGVAEESLSAAEKTIADRLGAPLDAWYRHCRKKPGDLGPSQSG